MLEDFKLPISLILEEIDEIENSLLGNLLVATKLNTIREKTFQLQALFNQISILRGLELGTTKLEITNNNFEVFLNSFPAILPKNKSGRQIDLPIKIKITDSEVGFDVAKLEQVFYGIISIYWILSPDIKQVSINMNQKSKNNKLNTNHYTIQIEGKTPILSQRQIKLFQQIVKVNAPLNTEDFGKLPIDLAIISNLIALHSGKIILSFSKAKMLKFTLDLPLKKSPSTIEYFTNNTSFFLKTFEEFNSYQLEKNEWFNYNQKYQLNLGNINTKDQQFLTTVLVLIEAHLDDETYWVDELVTDMFISRSTFFRRLKKITQQAPNDFMRAIRLKCAATLIKENKYNISEVSYQVGFKNPNYFGTCFRQMYGVPPSLYATNTKHK